LVTPLPSGIGAGKTPAWKAITHATDTRMSPIIRKRPALAPSADVDGVRRDSPDWLGNSAIKRVAIAVAACSGQTLLGMLAMIRARLSVASDFGNPANRPASSHGSFPSRANTETRLRVMPFASVPTAAKRNSFSPERRKAKASEQGI